MKNYWTTHRSTLLFFLSMFAIYGVWYLVYDLWLLPDGRLDRWLSLSVAAVSESILSAFGFDVQAAGRVLRLPGVNGIEIADGCNGLTTIGLFIGFIIAYPGRWLYRVLFIPVGIFVIYLTNVLRTIAMLLVQVYWPVAFDPLHSFGLTAVFYVVVFGLWVVWANYGMMPQPRLAASVS